MKNPQHVALCSPFPFADIQWCAGQPNADKTSAVVLPKLDPRAVATRLDEVLGVDGWKLSYREVVAGQKLVAVVAALSVRFSTADGSEWVTKEDAAHVCETMNVITEFAIKGAYTDAFKRAASMWGVGRYLYKMPRVRAALDGNQRPIMTAEVWAQLGVAEPPASADTEVQLPASPPTPTETPKPEPVQDSRPPAPPQENAPPRAPALQPTPPTRAPRVVPAPAPEPVPAPAPEEKPGSDECPENLSPAEKLLVDELTLKIQKLPPTMVRSFIDGPKGKQSLSPESRAYLLGLVAKRENRN